MLITSQLDKEVQKHINFIQNEYKCVIAISDDGDCYHMAVLFIQTGEIIDDIYLCDKADNKFRFMIAIRNYFKNR